MKALTTCTAALCLLLTLAWASPAVTPAATTPDLASLEAAIFGEAPACASTAAGVSFSDLE